MDLDIDIVEVVEGNDESGGTITALVNGKTFVLYFDFGESLADMEVDGKDGSAEDWEIAESIISVSMNYC